MKGIRLAPIRRVTKTVAVYGCLFLVATTAMYSQDGLSNPSNRNMPGVKDQTLSEDPSANYLEMAVDYINRQKYELALKYLEATKNSGDAQLYEDAMIWELYIRAVRGEMNLEDEIEFLSEPNKAKALYFVADGWANYFEKNPVAIEVRDRSMEMKEKLIARHPDSRWGYIASMQLAPALIESKQYDKALYYLLNYFESSNNAQSYDFDYDKAWFYLGQILEDSSEYRDLHRALDAYEKASEDPQGQFYTQAKMRIKEIEQFYYITP